jgi:hypothetical protein
MPRISALMAALLAAGLALPAYAQTGSRPPKPAPVASSRAPRAAPAARPGAPAPRAAALTPAAQRAKAVRGQILRTRVGLSEERAGKVEAILDRNAPERRRLQGEIQAATKALRELMRANSQDQQAYARALEQLRAGQKALRNLREREDEAVRQVLKPREQALLLRSLENLRRKARAPAPPPRPRA